MPTITILADALRFALPHVSTEERRPILNGLLVEPSGVICATNGHSMLAYRHAATGATAPVILAFAKPTEVTKKAVHSITLEVPEADANGNVRAVTGIVATVRDMFEHPIGVTLVDIVEGPFPYWRQVFPRPDQEAVSTDYIGFSPAVAARFNKSSDKPYHMTLYGPQRAVVVQWAHDGNALGLWMPCVPYERKPLPTPDWVTESGKQPAEATA